MRPAEFSELASVILSRESHGGIFVSSGDMEKPSVLTIGWGGLTYFWSRPVFLLPVRLSRYSHDVIENCGFFTVSVPLHDMSEALKYTGKVSGRDENKFESGIITAGKARMVPCPIVAECEAHLECRVLLKSAMDEALMDASVLSTHYRDHDMHDLYFGEVLSMYYTKD
ncbi:MAG: flavin reductase family protein [Eubacteriales bacterium]|nr:flavin reductase family protein [Eubacteriales bacterium]MDD3883055.1 flavin reductase family protein [Eubacteriales bacterium]MDD4513606.1 flavin reductase family protein [Eubacteriales bacterium]